MGRILNSLAVLSSSNNGTSQTPATSKDIIFGLKASIGELSGLFLSISYPSKIPL